MTATIGADAGWDAKKTTDQDSGNPGARPGWLVSGARQGDLHMLRKWSFLFALVVMYALVDYGLAQAFPAKPNALAAAAPTSSDIQLARVVAGRGPGGRGFVAGRGPGGRGFVAGRGGYRVGGSYYGGTWYGTGRRFWGGRWWPYGVGSCWRSSPIGYVWVCG